MDKCRLDKCLLDKCLLDKCLLDKCLLDKYLLDKCLLNKCLLDNCMLDKCLLDKYLLDNCLLDKLFSVQRCLYFQKKVVTLLDQITINFYLINHKKLLLCRHYLYDHFKWTLSFCAIILNDILCVKWQFTFLCDHF